MKPRTLLDKMFTVSLLLKGLDGLLELIGAVLLLVIPTISINNLATFLTQHELNQDPHDFIASHIMVAAHHLSSSSTLFGATYLFLHGTVKVTLVVAVLKGKLWAYPWMIGFLMLFTGYQIYRLTYTFSIGLMLLTVFDIFIIILTWLEYNRHQKAVDAV